MIAEENGILLSKYEAVAVQLFSALAGVLAGALCLSVGRRYMAHELAIGLAFVALSVPLFVPLSVQQARRGIHLSTFRFALAVVVGAALAGVTAGMM